MPEEIENIEARLCAYIDGELDEAARQEIERHLASNPQHRRLMQEMTRARQLLQDLPHAPAPPEIEEAIHSHLERSVLLDDSAAGSAPLRLRRWPRIISAAAIILLAAGLGIIVWLVVRPPVAPRTTAVNLPPPIPATVPSDIRMETANAANSRQNLKRAVGSTASEDSSAAAAPTTRPSSDQTQALTMAKVAQSPSPGLSASPRPASDQLGLLAMAPDPLQVELQVRAFLSSQGLHAQTIDLPSPSFGLMIEPQKALAVQGIDHEQVRSLRRLLDASATTTLDSLDAPIKQTALSITAAPTTEPTQESLMPATQPVPDTKADLLILIRPAVMSPSVEAAPETATEPATQPATAPATAPTLDDYQMP